MQTCQVRCKGQILHYHVSLAGIPGPFPYRRSKSTLFSECQSNPLPFYQLRTEWTGKRISPSTKRK